MPSYTAVGNPRHCGKTISTLCRDTSKRRALSVFKRSLARDAGDADLFKSNY